MILFSQYLEKVWIPIPTPTLAKKLRYSRFKVFALFPVLLTILIMWGVCGICTLAGVENPNIRLDGARMTIFNKADWFRVPYPCKDVKTRSLN